MVLSVDGWTRESVFEWFNRVEEAVSCFESLSGWVEGCQWSVKGVHTGMHVCVSMCKQEDGVVVPMLAL